MNLLITGITGNIGSRLLSAVKNHDAVNVTGGSHNDEKARIVHDNIDMRKLDFKDPDTYAPALESIDVVFLVRPPAISNVKRYIFPFLDAAAVMKIKHIVFLSLQGVEKNPVTPHHKIEKYIQKTGLPYTFLRPSFFMENLTTTHRREIKEKSEIIVPAGSGKTNFIAGADIAEFAATVITNRDDHLNKSWDLTGSKSYDYHEVAAILSRELGRDIEYNEPSILRFISHRREYGDELGYIMVMVALYSVCRFGMASGYSDDFERILGRFPESLEAFVKENRETWL